MPRADRVDRAEDLRFVKDGFSWTASVAPPLAMAASRLWLALTLYLIGLLLLLAGMSAAKSDPRWTSVIVIAIHILIGFEFSSLKRWTLRRGGWSTIASVTGSNFSECERRFFEGWLPGQPILTAVAGAQKDRSSFATVRRERSFWPFASKARA